MLGIELNAVRAHSMGDYFANRHTSAFSVRFLVLTESPNKFGAMLSAYRKRLYCLFLPVFLAVAP